MLSSTDNIAVAVVTILHHYQWRRIAIITESGTQNLFSEVRSVIVLMMDSLVIVHLRWRHVVSYRNLRSHLSS